MLSKIFPLFLASVVFVSASEPAPEAIPRAVPVAAPVAEANLPGLNAAVLRAITTMPYEGGYGTTGMSTRLLRESIVPMDRGLVITPANVHPSFCSGATYLVFVTVVRELMTEGKIRLAPKDLKTFRISPGQRDGDGIWGRWNANGPGTAALFYQLKLGANFTDYARARPGDFMKIFWSQEIGKRERGHSVVFLGLEKGDDGIEYVRFWSSNQPRGYGEKRVRREDVKFAIFSRFENPAGLLDVAKASVRDEYLASLLITPTTLEEVREHTGF